MSSSKYNASATFVGAKVLQKMPHGLEILFQRLRLDFQKLIFFKKGIFFS